MQARQISPPVDLTKSLTRIGGSSRRVLRSAPQAPALRRLVEGLRLGLVNAIDESSVGAATAGRDEAGLFTSMWQRIIEQDPAEPRPLSLQVVRALGAVHFRAIGQPVPVELLERKALECASDVLKVIDATHELSDENLATLERLGADVCESLSLSSIR